MSIPLTQYFFPVYIFISLLYLSFFFFLQQCSSTGQPRPPQSATSKPAWAPISSFPVETAGVTVALPCFQKSRAAPPIRPLVAPNIFSFYFILFLFLFFSFFFVPVLRVSMLEPHPAWRPIHNFWTGFASRAAVLPVVRIVKHIIK